MNISRITRLSVLITRLALLILPVVSSSYGQGYPQDYFIAPMDTPLYLSAPFGSLRENHFHSGMDIRTYEREGLPVYAVADGYVSRIKVSPYGYGKAVYIDHPNGYTSVYGHLQRYHGELATYIRQYQYKNQTFDLDHFPGRNVIRVSKGQLIGYSGNSGGSTGPHLHFEIRDTRREEPINPQLFGIPAVDTLPPFLKRIAVYAASAFPEPLLVGNYQVNTARLLHTDSGYYYPDTLKAVRGMNGFGIEAYDHQLTRDKEYSIYSCDLSVDGIRRFGFRLERINFDNTKDINVHIDYETYKKEGYRIQKCFLADGNRSQIYSFMRNRGFVSLSDTGVHLLRITLGDVSGHTFTFYVPVRAYAASIPATNPCTEITFYPNRDNLISNAATEIKVPAGALYDTVRVCYTVFQEKIKSLRSAVVQVHHPFTPLRKNITVAIKCDSAYSSKLLLASILRDGSLRSAGGGYHNGKVSASVSQFGNYAVVLDSTRPEIKLLNADRNGRVTDTTALYIRITDNFSGIQSYEATLNGKWILADYDAKNSLLTYIFDDRLTPNQKQELVVTVVDKKGNTAVLKKELTVIR